MADPIRFGVIGCGVIHKNHCDSINAIDGAVLAAVCDVDEARAVAAAEAYGVAHCTSVHEMWDLVDAVTICTPSGMHAAIGIEAARAGKHVLTEKPVDIQYGAASALLKSCEEAGVWHGCISQHRFAGDIRRTREAVMNGEFGPMVQGDAYVKWYRTQAYYDSGDWRGTWALDGGGCLMNQGVHYVDMVQWVMGGVEAVRAITRTMAHDIEVEDTACALVEYKNGAVGVIQGSTSVYPGSAERLEVHGRYGTAIVEGDRIKVWEVEEEFEQSNPNRRERPSVGAAEGGVAASDPTAIWGEQHRLQIEDFVHAIRDHRAPAMTVKDAMEPLKVILAIYESSRRGGERVSVSEVMD